MDKPNSENWLFVIIQNPGTGREQLLGYTDEGSDETFVPAFKSKEIAQQCFLMMPKDIMNQKYEIQAILKEDLITYTSEEQHAVALLDDKGRILEKLA